MEVTRLAAEGLENQEIANRLGISQGTLGNYLSRIYRKLAVEAGYNPRATLVRDYVLWELTAGGINGNRVHNFYYPNNLFSSAHLGIDSLFERKMKQTWIEQYKCGCSNKAPTKKDLPGYCAQHGSNVLVTYHVTNKGIVTARESDNTPKPT
jgi:hypothetical protein